MGVICSCVGGLVHRYDSHIKRISTTNIQFDYANVYNTKYILGAWVSLKYNILCTHMSGGITV